MPATRDDLVLGFDQIDASMLATVGGKAANLGELTRANLPVPPGLCITTTAYELVAAGAAIDGVLDALAATAADDVAALTDLAGRARAALLAAPVPPAVGEAVTRGYAGLGTDVPVAVRSSATARCWASLWTERAVVYRASNGIDHRAVRLAVVIQRMVDAQVSGVLFTANPVTGRRRQAVIDASPGLGEAVVSGAVNPDHFMVDTATGEIVTRRLGDKRLAIRALPGGGTARVTLADGADRACVTEEQVRAIAAIGDRLEAHYGAPQDGEWVLDPDGALWLTQARPITTLYPLPAAAPSPGEQLRAAGPGSG